MPVTLTGTEFSLLPPEKTLRTFPKPHSDTILIAADTTKQDLPGQFLLPSTLGHCQCHGRWTDPLCLKSVLQESSTCCKHPPLHFYLGMTFSSAVYFIFFPPQDKLLPLQLGGNQEILCCKYQQSEHCVRGHWQVSVLQIWILKALILCQYPFPLNQTVQYISVTFCTASFS